MDVIECLEWRYATKKFDPKKKLSQNKIDILKKAFNLTATSFGLQPIKLLIISNKELQEKFIEIAYNQRMVADASHLLIICIENDTTKDDIMNYFELEKSTRGTEESVIAGFREQLIAMYAKMTLQEKQTSATYQAYIALGNLLTVCAVEKIDAIPMEGFVPSKVDELLNLKALNLSSVLLLPVGYRANDDIMKDMKKVRKPLNKTIIEF